jgi:hypothetical protein
MPDDAARDALAALDAAVDTLLHDVAHRRASIRQLLNEYYAAARDDDADDDDTPYTPVRPDRRL